MTLISIDRPNFGPTVKFTGRLTTFRFYLVERYRQWRQYRTTLAELHQYSDGELVELGITRYDVEEIANRAEELSANS